MMILNLRMRYQSHTGMMLLVKWTMILYLMGNMLNKIGFVNERMRIVKNLLVRLVLLVGQLKLKRLIRYKCSSCFGNVMSQ